MIAASDRRAFHTPIEADRGAALDEYAAAFALRSANETDVMIEALSNEAIREWRLADATFWQRVRFRARRLRAAPVGAN